MAAGDHLQGLAAVLLQDLACNYSQKDTSTNRSSALSTAGPALSTACGALCMRRGCRLHKSGILHSLYAGGASAAGWGGLACHSFTDAPQAIVTPPTAGREYPWGNSVYTRVVIINTPHPAETKKGF